MATGRQRYDEERCGLMGVTGRCVVRRSDGLLLLRRSAESTFDPGRWELPGGKCRFGEDLVAAVRRETVEETGLAVELGDPFAVWHFLKDHRWITGVTFLVESWHGKVALSPEHDTYAWVALDDLTVAPLATTAQAQVDACGTLTGDRLPGRSDAARRG